ncbi:leucine-rich repeat-containing protein 43-like isoform X4 [Syngnathus typhle]|uniref:leucine-rich repeat-containing protein 43-like isoform X4 n=1 Tax=Syngnathus typhle TaxID=161592 RepID=UPI002A6A4FD0|nr:leucine-rich repeat-containing protein 43-like isoform X4 [Syngnathus typhle]
MSSVALSAVLDKHIRRLCLDQFPCGKGSWRKDGGSEAEAVTEDTDALLDLLNCPHSPWHHDEPWSPQAAALQRVAVVEPERLDADFVCSYFRKLRIVDKDVSVVDNYLLKFCNLQELVLSANRISEISAENLPRTLKVLELRANQLCALGRLAISPPPRLQYLGLAANRLGSHRDVTLLTGKQWPELVCLDLSECDFREQRPLLKALDAAWIAPEERHRYRGMANMSPTVRVGVMQGVPDPQDDDPDAPEFPVVSYSYVISYMFFSHQTTAYQEVVIGGPAKRQSQDQGAEPTQSLNKKSVKEIVVVNLADCGEDQTSSSCESRYNTSSQPWADCVDYGHVLTFVVRDLSSFKKFLHRGFFIFIEQEKILSWPAEVTDDSGQGATDKKGKKPKTTKDKRKKSVVELVADPPVTTVVASSHVSLRGLLGGYQKVDILCDFGSMHKDPPVEEASVTDENVSVDSKSKDDSKKKGNRAGFKKPGKGMRREESNADTPSHPETVTVELSVELKKWRHASEVAPLVPANS